MKNLYLLLTAVLILYICLFSCKKKDASDPETPAAKKCTLKQVKINDKLRLTFEYDSGDQLIRKRFYKNDGSESHLIAYDYTPTLITEKTFYGTDTTAYETIRHYLGSNGYVSLRVRNVHTTIDSTFFTYNGLGFLVRSINIQDYGSGPITDTTNYFYSDGNLMKTINFWGNTSDTTSYTYTSLPNKLGTSRLEMIEGKKSKNLVEVITSGQYKTTLQYEMNAQNYPVKITYTESSKSDVQSLIYDCSK
jgi:hypothetical protein